MKRPPFEETWQAIGASPLFALTLTLLAYLAGMWLFRRTRQHPLANPVLVAIVLTALVLNDAHIPYSRYFEGAGFIHFLLGPATVGLAVPLYAYWQHLRKMVLPLTVALLAGSLTAVVSAMALASLLGASAESIRSLAPKSVTTPIAMSIAVKIGGLPSLTAVLVVVTGIFGAVGFSGFFRLLRIRDHKAQGFAVGLAAHGLGTARAFQISEEMGAFATLGMSLNGLLTAVLLPVLLR